MFSYQVILVCFHHANAYEDKGNHMLSVKLLLYVIMCVCGRGGESTIHTSEIAFLDGRVD